MPLESVLSMHQYYFFDLLIFQIGSKPSTCFPPIRPVVWHVLMKLFDWFYFAPVLLSSFHLAINHSSTSQPRIMKLITIRPDVTYAQRSTLRAVHVANQHKPSTWFRPVGLMVSHVLLNSKHCSNNFFANIRLCNSELIKKPNYITCFDTKHA